MLVKGKSTVLNETWPLPISEDGTAVKMQMSTSTSGGSTPYSLISLNTANPTVVKASAGQLYDVEASNLNASPAYLKIYDKATTPLVGDTPKLRLLIPGTGDPPLSKSFPGGIAFANGIGFRITTGSADSDTGVVAAGEVLVNLIYK